MSLLSHRTNALGFVVLDRDTYITKARSILEEAHAYQKLSSDPTRQVQTAITREWRDIATDKVPKNLVDMLVPRHSR